MNFKLEYQITTILGLADNANETIEASSLCNFIQVKYDDPENFKPIDKREVTNDMDNNKNTTKIRSPMVNKSLLKLEITKFAR